MNTGRQRVQPIKGEHTYNALQLYVADCFAAFLHSDRGACTVLLLLCIGATASGALLTHALLPFFAHHADLVFQRLRQ